MAQFIMYCILIAIFLETSVIFALVVLDNNDDEY